VLHAQAVFNLQLLTHLNLSDNDIGYLPPAISRLVNLEYLDISKNSKFMTQFRSLHCAILILMNGLSKLKLKGVI